MSARTAFTLLWRPEASELDGDALVVDRAVGLRPADLLEFDTVVPANAGLEVRSASMGKGAEFAALALVVTIERFATDTASLIAIGSALAALIRRLRRRRSSPPLTEDPLTMTALGAASVADALAGAEYSYTIPITASPGVGTDERDVWAAVFQTDDPGELLVMFLSPSGKCLGLVTVQEEFYFDGREWTTRARPEIRLGQPGVVEK